MLILNSGEQVRDSRGVLPIVERDVCPDVRKDFVQDGLTDDTNFALGWVY